MHALTCNQVSFFYQACTPHLVRYEKVRRLFHRLFITDPPSLPDARSVQMTGKLVALLWKENPEKLDLILFEIIDEFWFDNGLRAHTLTQVFSPSPHHLTSILGSGTAAARHWGETQCYTHVHKGCRLDTDVAHTHAHTCTHEQPHIHTMYTQKRK